MPEPVHTIPVGSAVAGTATVDGVDETPVGGIVVAFAPDDEEYIVAIGFQVVNGSQLVHAREVLLVDAILATALFT